MKTEPHLAPPGPAILTLTELRVLSGLSRGAAMPLEDSITIGSDFDCDLILVDEGVAERHAILARSGDGHFALTLLSSSLDGTVAKGTTAITEGEAFELSGVRMLVCQSDAAWDFSLPVPVPPPLSAIEAAVADGVAAGRLGRGAATVRQEQPKANVKRLALIGVAGAAVVVAALLLLSPSAEPEPPPVVAPAPAAARLYSEPEVQEIATAFALRLDELTIPGIKLITAPHQLLVKGYVDRLAESRFESAVQDVRDANPGLKVRLELGGEPVAALPFEVTAAVGGSNGSVLLADGQQLFVGAEEAGFKFLGLVGNCINFIQVATQQKVSQCSEPNQRRR